MDSLIAQLRDIQSRTIATTLPGEAADALEKQKKLILDLQGIIAAQDERISKAFAALDGEFDDEDEDD